MGSHRAAARVDALTVAMSAHRTRDRAPTIGDLPNGVEIARQMAIILELEHSRDPADQQRVRVAALRAGALMPRPGHPEHPNPALLGAVLIEEETFGADPDPGFWQAVGGRPECNWAHAGASRDSPPDLVHFP
jgi:hypothetical protein